MKKYDAIIIGAGNGGLAAAAKLAVNGKKVVLIEKNHTPGGVAVSFRRGRFDFEVSLHELCGFGRHDKPFGGVRSFFDELGISDRIEWVDIPDAYRIITYDSKDNIDFISPFGIEKYIDAVSRYVPGSRKGMENIFSLASEYLSAVNGMGKIKSAGDAMKLFRTHRDFFHTCSKSVDAVLNEMKIPAKAADIFRGYWAYLCADCGNLMFFHYICMVRSYIDLGSVIPKARSLELSLMFVRLIKEHGGEVLLNTEVKEVCTENGRAYGVRTSDGGEYFADWVLCDISPSTVFGSMIDKKQITVRDRKKTNSRELSGRGFCVYLGLNRSAEELGLKDYSYFIYPDMNTEKQYHLMERPETNGVQNTICINAVDPTASPEGTCMLTMTTLFTSDYWEGLSDAGYYEEKNRFADKMIKTFEKATGIIISDCIEEIEIAAPQTFARYMNSPQGAIYGYKASHWDGILARKMMDKQFTDIRGLEFIGGFAHNLNGYSSSYASGNDKANYILKSGN